jgi:hypothetical protein
MTYRDIKEIRNDGDNPLEVWVEPWAFALDVPPTGALLFESDSEEEGCFEIIESNGIAIFAWPGANLRVTREGTVVYETENRSPGIPRGLTMRQFMELVFGLSPAKRAWWKFCAA